METHQVTRGPILLLLLAIVMSTYMAGRTAGAVSVALASVALVLFGVGHLSLELMWLDPAVIITVFVATGVVAGLLWEHRARAMDAAQQSAETLRKTLIDFAAMNDELHHRNDLVEAIAANAASGLIFIDAKRMPIFVNDAWTAMTGYTLEDMAGRQTHDVVHHSRPDGTPYPIEECPLDHANAARQPLRDVEEMFVRKDGTFFPALCSMMPLQRDGRITGSVFEVHDITSLKEAQEGLEEALRARDEFISLVSHELRSPITTIKGNAELLRDRWSGVSQTDRDLALADVASEAERLRRIVDSLLMLARLERGVTLEAEPTLAHRVAAEIAGQYQARSGRTVEVRALSQDAAMCSATYVGEVIDNFVSNALKYSPPPEPVVIEIDAVDEFSIIRVLDSGPGVRDEDAGELFTPFFRGAQSGGRIAGLGIGLAVCRRIAESHGGRIWVRRRPAGGSEFGVALPRAVETAVTAG